MQEKLKKLSLFFNVEDQIIDEISSFTNLKTFKKDEIIFYEKEKKPYFYGIVSGEILMYDVDLKGNIIPKNQYGCKEIFGLISKIQNRSYCLNAKALNESEVLLINYEKFKKFISSPPFSDRIIKMLTNQIVNEVEFNKLIKYPAKKRVILALLNFPHRFIRKKKYLLAKELNMTPETLSRILSKLKQKELICYCEKSIKVLDPKALEEELE